MHWRGHAMKKTAQGRIDRYFHNDHIGFRNAGWFASYCNSCTWMGLVLLHLGDIKASSERHFTSSCSSWYWYQFDTHQERPKSKACFFLQDLPIWSRSRKPDRCSLIPQSAGAGAFRFPSVRYGALPSSFLELVQWLSRLTRGLVPLPHLVSATIQLCLPPLRIVACNLLKAVKENKKIK